MIRTQFFSPDDDESDYRELESPEIETGTLAINPEPSTSADKGSFFHIQIKT